MNNYDGKEALAWLRVNPNYSEDDGHINNRCYVFPRFLIENNKYIEIDSGDFPDRGAVEVYIAGGKSAYDIENEFGRVLIVKFNVTPGQNQNLIGGNRLFAKYNPRHPETEINFEKINTLHLRQVVEVDSTYEFLEQIKNFTLSRPMNIITKEILIRLEDTLYGPFACVQQDDKVEISAIEGQSYNSYIGKFDLEYVKEQLISVKDERNQINTLFLYGLEKSSIFSLANVKYDWVSDAAMVGETISILKASEGGEFSRETRNKVRRRLEESVKKHKSEFLEDSARVEKMFSLLDRTDKLDVLRGELVNEAVTNPLYKDKLVEYILETSFDSIKEDLEYSKRAQSDKIEREEEIEKLSSAIVLLKKELKEKEKNKEKAKKDIRVEMDSELIQIKNDIDVEQKKKDTLVKYNKLAEDYLELERKKDIAKNRYDTWSESKREMETELNKKIKNVTAEAAIQLIDKDFLSKVLNIIDGESIEAQKPNVFDNSLLFTDFTAETLIEHLLNYVIIKAGRNYHKNDIINYLVCISQGFVTMFAGEPGTGKTSLCNIIANALGIAGDSKNKRFVEVAVERGWRSSKDYIGYYNPLTKTFEKSNKDVFDAFETLDREGDLSRAPYFILLDEANLSPIEHYWANFMRISDLDSNKRRSISIGEEKDWQIPETLRFLATVNFDHTTEELSQRFLDRTWVIMLEQDSISEDMSIDDGVENFEKVYDFNKLLEYFMPKENGNTKLDESIRTKWNSIKSIFGRANLPITPRRIKMVSNYCLIAGRYMDLQLDETAPLDYAVVQKILPSINGVGLRYTQLVDELLSECDSGMPLCKKRLLRMKQAADENMGYYQFFAK